MEHHNHRLDRREMLVEKNKLMDVWDHSMRYVFDEQDFPLDQK
jgi:hypothetical protein